MELGPGRRLKISNKLKDFQADIVLLLEINLSKTAADVLTIAQFPHVYSACYNSRQRGVAILIIRRVNFTVHNTVIDPEGRFLIVNLSIPSIFYTVNPLVGSRGGWSLSQRSSGGWRGTPWTGRQSITGPHRDK